MSVSKMSDCSPKSNSLREYLESANVKRFAGFSLCKQDLLLTRRSEHSRIFQVVSLIAGVQPDMDDELLKQIVVSWLSCNRCRFDGETSMMEFAKSRVSIDVNSTTLIMLWLGCEVAKGTAYQMAQCKGKKTVCIFTRFDVGRITLRHMYVQVDDLGKVVGPAVTETLCYFDSPEAYTLASMTEADAIMEMFETTSLAPVEDDRTSEDSQLVINQFKGVTIAQPFVDSAEERAEFFDWMCDMDSEIKGMNLLEAVRRESMSKSHLYVISILAWSGDKHCQEFMLEYLVQEETRSDITMTFDVEGELLLVGMKSKGSEESVPPENILQLSITSEGATGSTRICAMNEAISSGGYIPLQTHSGVVETHVMEKVPEMFRNTYIADEKMICDILGHLLCICPNPNQSVLRACFFDWMTMNVVPGEQGVSYFQAAKRLAGVKKCGVVAAILAWCGDESARSSFNDEWHRDVVFSTKPGFVCAIDTDNGFQVDGWPLPVCITPDASKFALRILSAYDAALPDSKVNLDLKGDTESITESELETDRSAGGMAKRALETTLDRLSECSDRREKQELANTVDSISESELRAETSSTCNSPDSSGDEESVRTQENWFIESIKKRIEEVEAQIAQNEKETDETGDDHLYEYEHGALYDTLSYLREMIAGCEEKKEAESSTNKQQKPEATLKEVPNPKKAAEDSESDAEDAAGDNESDSEVDPESITERNLPDWVRESVLLILELEDDIARGVGNREHKENRVEDVEEHLNEKGYTWECVKKMKEMLRTTELNPDVEAPVDPELFCDLQTAFNSLEEEERLTKVLFYAEQNRLERVCFKDGLKTLGATSRLQISLSENLTALKDSREEMKVGIDSSEVEQMENIAKVSASYVALLEPSSVERRLSQIVIERMDSACRRRDAIKAKYDKLFQQKLDMEKWTPDVRLASLQGTIESCSVTIAQCQELLESLGLDVEKVRRIRREVEALKEKANGLSELGGQTSASDETFKRPVFELTPEQYSHLSIFRQLRHDALASSLKGFERKLEEQGKLMDQNYLKRQEMRKLQKDEIQRKLNDDWSENKCFADTDHAADSVDEQELQKDLARYNNLARVVSEMKIDISNNYYLGLSEVGRLEDGTFPDDDPRSNKEKKVSSEDGSECSDTGNQKLDEKINSLKEEQQLLVARMCELEESPCEQVTEIGADVCAVPTSEEHNALAERHDELETQIETLTAEQKASEKTGPKLSDIEAINSEIQFLEVSRRKVLADLSEAEMGSPWTQPEEGKEAICFSPTEKALELQKEYDQIGTKLDNLYELRSKMLSG